MLQMLIHVKGRTCCPLLLHEFMSRIKHLSTCFGWYDMLATKKPARMQCKFQLLQGCIAATSPTFGHTLPTVFPEPNKFSPNRFKQDPNVKVSFCPVCTGFVASPAYCVLKQALTLHSAVLSVILVAYSLFKGFDCHAVAGRIVMECPCCRGLFPSLALVEGGMDAWAQTSPTFKSRPYCQSCYGTLRWSW